MALPRGVKRYQHLITNEIRYFRNPPNLKFWEKVGTPGSKDWRWISNLTEEKFIHKTEPIPEGWELGRIRA